MKIQKVNLNFYFRKQEDVDSQILVQLDVFDEQKANDEEQLPGIKGVDLNSPLDVFHAIFTQVRFKQFTIEIFFKFISFQKIFSKRTFTLCHYISCDKNMFSYC